MIWCRAICLLQIYKTTVNRNWNWSVTFCRSLKTLAVYNWWYLTAMTLTFRLRRIFLLTTVDFFNFQNFFITVPYNTFLHCTFLLCIFFVLFHSVANVFKCSVAHFWGWTELELERSECFWRPGVNGCLSAVSELVSDSTYYVGLMLLARWCGCLKKDDDNGGGLLSSASAT